MNTFDIKIKEHGHYPLKAAAVSTLQVNICYICNLKCIHCHVEASPERDEVMSKDTMEKIVEILRDNSGIRTVDITGGAPEMHPEFRYFVEACRSAGKDVMVRSNLAIYSEPGMEDIPDFLVEHKVKIIASLPCYSEQGVDMQRGKGTYNKAIAALKTLNSLGYGIDGTGLEIDLMFNPAKTGIAPDQTMLEKDYRQNLADSHGIQFNNLIALSNMPIGRLQKTVSDDESKAYIKELEEKFNPHTVENVMCRHLVSVAPDGRLYDCDFWQMLDMPVKGKSRTVDDFDYEALSHREVVSHPLCFMCTAGSGASCGGALT